uniref:Conserved domain protein n=1 Tax=Panagrellus redivivus TaxID=6233 RepID=A0A7E4ZW07_PANRE
MNPASELNSGHPYAGSEYNGNAGNGSEYNGNVGNGSEFNGNGNGVEKKWFGSNDNMAKGALRSFDEPVIWVCPPEKIIESEPVIINDKEYPITVRKFTSIICLGIILIVTLVLVYMNLKKSKVI